MAMERFQIQRRIRSLPNRFRFRSENWQRMGGWASDCCEFYQAEEEPTKLAAVFDGVAASPFLPPVRRAGSQARQVPWRGARRPGPPRSWGQLPLAPERENWIPGHGAVIRRIPEVVRRLVLPDSKERMARRLVDWLPRVAVLDWDFVPETAEGLRKHPRVMDSRLRVPRVLQEQTAEVHPCVAG